MDPVEDEYSRADEFIDSKEEEGESPEMNRESITPLEQDGNRN